MTGDGRPMRAHESGANATFSPPPTGKAPTRWSGAWGLRIAVAVAGLLLAAGLVVRVSVGLSGDSPHGRAQLGSPEAGVALSTDVVGRPLFDDVMLTPGEPEEACIQVRTHSAKDVGPLGLYVTGFEGDAALAEALEVVVEAEPGSPDITSGSCAGFVPEHTLFRGNLREAFDAHRDGATAARPVAGDPLRLTRYRVQVTLPGEPETAVGGRIDGLGLAWTTVAVSTQLTTNERWRAFALQVAGQSVIPLLIMLVVSVLFIGVQDRIDRSDPKLALAPIRYETVPFEPPHKR